jgi:predicted ABC-type ATPase
LLAAQQSFSVETTLSGMSYLRMVDEAKALGYRVVVIFVGTSDISINMLGLADV